MIGGTVAPNDPTEAFELLWSFLQLAPSIHERTDDSNGTIGAVMDDAMDVIAELSPKVSISPDALADRILDAVAGAGYGEFDGIIPATAPALGEDGLEHLKRITRAWIAAPSDREDPARHLGYGLSSSAEDRARNDRRLTGSIILADIADAQGDVDAYIARYSSEQLRLGLDPRGEVRVDPTDQIQNDAAHHQSVGRRLSQLRTGKAGRPAARRRYRVRTRYPGAERDRSWYRSYRMSW